MWFLKTDLDRKISITVIGKIFGCFLSKVSVKSFTFAISQQSVIDFPRK